MLNEVSLTEKDKITSDFSHMWNQKKKTEHKEMETGSEIQRKNLVSLGAVAGEVQRITDGD